MAETMVHHGPSTQPLTLGVLVILVCDRTSGWSGTTAPHSVSQSPSLIQPLDRRN